jgi:hypothetical protein
MDHPSPLAAALADDFENLGAKRFPRISIQTQVVSVTISAAGLQDQRLELLTALTALIL